MQGVDLTDCREALINAIVDPLVSYQRTLGQSGPILRMPTDGGIQYLPIYVLGLLKNVLYFVKFKSFLYHFKMAFSEPQQRITPDERVATLLLFKNASMEMILLQICPAFYGVHSFVEQANQQVKN